MPKRFNKISLTALPAEIQEMIFDRLLPNTLINLMLTNSEYNETSVPYRLGRWKTLREHFKHIPIMTENLNDMVDLDDVDKYLFSAVEFSYVPEIKILLQDKRFHINNVINYKSFDEGQTILTRAVIAGSYNIVKLLIDFGADVDHKDFYGNTPLMYTVRGRGLEPKEYINSAELLIHAGADINIANNCGDTVLIRSIQEESKDIIGLIIDNLQRDATKVVNIDATDNDDKTALIHVIEKRFYSIAKRLIDNGANVNYLVDRGIDMTPLMYAAITGSYDMTKLLIDNGADINIEDYMGYTALLYATQQLYSRSLHCDTSVQPCHDDIISTITLLINRGANINIIDSDERTPLMYAADTGSYDVAKLLIDKGTDINRVDDSGNTALSYAVKGENNHDKEKILDLLDLFMDNDATVDRITRVYASNSDMLKKYFIDKGYDFKDIKKY